MPTNHKTPPIRQMLTLAGASLLAGLAFPAPSVQAASFDCNKASAPVEKLICETSSVNAWDASLGYWFREILRVLPEADRTIYRQQQAAWLKQRDAECPVSRGALVAGKARTQAAECLAYAYEQRVNELETDASRLEAWIKPTPVGSYHLVQDNDRGMVLNIVSVKANILTANLEGSTNLIEGAKFGNVRLCAFADRPFTRVGQDYRGTLIPENEWTDGKQCIAILRLVGNRAILDLDQSGSCNPPMHVCGMGGIPYGTFAKVNSTPADNIYNH